MIMAEALSPAPHNLSRIRMVLCCSQRRLARTVVLACIAAVILVGGAVSISNRDPTLFFGLVFLLTGIWYLKHIWAVLLLPLVVAPPLSSIHHNRNSYAWPCCSCLLFGTVVFLGLLAFTLDQLYLEKGEPSLVWELCNDMAGCLVCMVLGASVSDLLEAASLLLLIGTDCSSTQTAAAKRPPPQQPAEAAGQEEEEARRGGPAAAAGGGPGGGGGGGGRRSHSPPPSPSTAQAAAAPPRPRPRALRLPLLPRPPLLRRTAPGRRARARAGLAAAAALAVYALVHGHAAPRVVELQIELPLLPPCLDGFRLAVVTDVHGGTVTGRAEVQALADQVAALDADALVLVGDVSDGLVGDLRPVLGPLASLGGGGLPHGAYFVTGNHELYFDTPENWRSYMEEIGFKSLCNERVAIPSNSTCSFDLIGLEDRDIGSDIDSALEGRNSSKASVLLAHQPVEFRKAVANNIGLTISGHTHGGHIFPAHAFNYMAQDSYVAGLFKQKKSYLYVSEGAMGWGPRTRLLSTREVAVLALRSPELSSSHRQGSAGQGEEAPGSRAAQRASYAAFAWMALVMAAWAVSWVGRRHQQRKQRRRRKSLSIRSAGEDGDLRKKNFILHEIPSLCAPSAVAAVGSDIEEVEQKQDQQRV